MKGKKTTVPSLDELENRVHVWRLIGIQLGQPERVFIDTECSRLPEITRRLKVNFKGAGVEVTYLTAGQEFSHLNSAKAALRKSRETKAKGIRKIPPRGGGYK